MSKNWKLSKLAYLSGLQTSFSSSVKCWSTISHEWHDVPHESCLQTHYQTLLVSWRLRGNQTKRHSYFYSSLWRWTGPGLAAVQGSEGLWKETPAALLLPHIHTHTHLSLDRDWSSLVLFRISSGTCCLYLIFQNYLFSGSQPCLGFSAM